MGEKLNFALSILSIALVLYLGRDKLFTQSMELAQDIGEFQL